MQILRTIIWVLLSVFIVMFVAINFGEPQRVKIWLTSNDAIGFDWPVGIIALVFFLLGAIPTWLYHRSVKWSQDRRIRSLENSIKSNALAYKRNTPATGEPKGEDSAATPASDAPPLTNSDDTLTPAKPDKDQGTS